MKEVQVLIETLIADGQLNEALKLLNDELRTNDFILLSGRNNTNERERDKGIITLEQYRMERNKIQYALLNTIERYNKTDIKRIEQIFKQVVEQKAPKSVSNSLNSAQKTEDKCKKVFISYSHDDSTIAFKIKEGLEKEDISVIIDKTHLKGGEYLPDFITRSVKEADVTLSLASESSLSSAWVSLETLNIFWAEKFADRKLIMCVTNEHIFSNKTMIQIAKNINKKLEELKGERQELMDLGFGTKNVDNDIDRHGKLKGSLGDTFSRITEYLSIIVSEEKWDKSLPRLVTSIKGE